MPDTRPAYHRSAPSPRLLLVFADGVGLAPEGPENPLATTPAPALGRLLDGPLTRERAGLTGPGLALAALDATLGVDGLPQSATGQTALFTGVNAAAVVGRHVSAFPGPQLRRLLRRHGLLGRLRAAGLAVTFANAYSKSYLETLAGGSGRRSATTCLVEFAGLGFRTEDALARNEAVTWDITRELFVARTGAAVTPVGAATAGRHLAAIAARHRFTLYETFLTDLAGHRRFGLSPPEAVTRLDGLLGGLLAAAPADLTLLLTSDHGNLEQGASRQHSRNPVPLLAVGPAAHRFADLSSIVEVTPRLLELLAGEPPGGGGDGRQDDASRSTGDADPAV